MSRRPPGSARPFRKPSRLRPGDTVAIVAPAGPVDRAAFDAGLAILAARYRPVHDEGLFVRTRYLAGDDDRRLDELRRGLGDPAVRAVFAARGGYGTLRLLARLGAAWDGGDGRGGAGKPVVGFSDVTALHLALQAAGWTSVHGPVVTQLGTQPPDVVDRLFRLVEDPVEPAPTLTGEPWVGGVAEGPLVGGNLSLLTRVLGTPHLPDVEGAVLLLEDVGERPYRLDRMWTHLQLAGVLDRVSGLALGEFVDCEEPGEAFSALEVLRGLVTAAGIPCVAGLPIGHGAVNVPVPLGCQVRLDAGAGTLAFLEPAVAPSR